jgi:hypothetical protein
VQTKVDMNTAIQEHAVRVLRNQSQPPRKVNSLDVLPLIWSSSIILLFLVGMLGLVGSTYNMARYSNINVIRFSMSAFAIVVSIVMLLSPFLEWLLIVRTLQKGVVKTAHITAIDSRTKAKSREKSVVFRGRWRYELNGKTLEEAFSASGRWAEAAKVGDCVRVLIYPQTKPMVVIPLEREPVSLSQKR